MQKQVFCSSYSTTKALLSFPRVPDVRACAGEAGGGSRKKEDADKGGLLQQGAAKGVGGWGASA